MIVRKYDINSNSRDIYSDEEAIDIALTGIKEAFLLCCNYDNGKANKDATFFITLELERPVKKKGEQ